MPVGGKKEERLTAVYLAGQFEDPECRQPDGQGSRVGGSGGRTPRARGCLSKGSNPLTFHHARASASERRQEPVNWCWRDAGKLAHHVHPPHPPHHRTRDLMASRMRRPAACLLALESRDEDED